MDRLFSRNASKFSSLVNEHCQVLKLKTIQMSMETFGIFFSALIVSLLAVNRFVLHAISLERLKRKILEK